MAAVAFEPATGAAGAAGAGLPRGRRTLLGPGATGVPRTADSASAAPVPGAGAAVTESRVEKPLLFERLGRRVRSESQREVEEEAGGGMTEEDKGTAEEGCSRATAVDEGDETIFTAETVTELAAVGTAVTVAADGTAAEFAAGVDAVVDVEGAAVAGAA